MCGIYCRLRPIKQDAKISPVEIDATTKQLLTNRGPNAHNELTIQTDSYSILFSGFVLWQQGAELCSQPLIYKHHILLINGDIFTKRNDCTLSDTEWLSRKIDACNDETDLIDLFRSLEGPYSIVYFNQITHKLYFLRDIFGRQSLLLAISLEDDTVLSSVLAASNRHYVKCIEIPPLGIFSMNLSLSATERKIHLTPWQSLSGVHEEQLNKLNDVLHTSIEVETSIVSPWLIKKSFADNSIGYNFETILKDYVNDTPVDIFNRLLDNSDVMSVCNEIITSLKNSLFDRIIATPSFCRECLHSGCRECSHARIAILFSGGIDCTILALLTDKLINQCEPIDLINVSFEKFNRSMVKTNEINYNTPDRISARESLDELKVINPNRKWNLVEINVSRNELSEALKNRVPHLVSPLNTVLDESLGSVLWFGARGRGTVNGVEYFSNCRVMLIGSGADEIFGGYTRHRNAFIRQYTDGLTPFERLENELEFDFNRLPSRNLARDDRVIGDHGVTCRAPFLEEKLVHFVRALKPYQKCFHALEQGVGDKLLLRLCGYHLDLRKGAYRKKRAMQFGSRIADSKQNAKDISQSLVHILNA